METVWPQLSLYYPQTWWPDCLTRFEILASKILTRCAALLTVGFGIRYWKAVRNMRVLIQIITWGGELFYTSFMTHIFHMHIHSQTLCPINTRTLRCFFTKLSVKKLLWSSLESRLLAHIPTTCNWIFYPPIWRSFKNEECPHRFSRSSVFQKSNDNIL